MAPHIEGGAPGPGGAGAAGSGLHAGRRIADTIARARGRTAFKFEVTIIPFFASELPDVEGGLCLTWTRGAKASSTEPAPVNPHTRACFWSEHLRQVITVYQEGVAFLPKEYSLKVVAASGRTGREERRTVGKARLDLAAFCDAEAEPLPKEVFLKLKPAGKLKLSVKAGWLKDAPIEPDAATEASWNTGRSGEARFGEHSDGGGDEQDLSGFHLGLEGAGGGAHGGGPHGGEARMVGVPLGPPAGQEAIGGDRRGSVLGRNSQQLGAAVEAAALHVIRERGSSGGGSGGRGGGSPAAVYGSPRPGGTPRAAGRVPGAGSGGGTGSPRIAALGGLAASAVAAPEEEGGGEGRGGVEVAKEKARVIAAAQQHVQAMWRASDEALETEAGAGWVPPPPRRSSIWDTLCCCWPRKKTRFIPAVPEVGSARKMRPPAEEPCLLPPTTAEL